MLIVLASFTTHSPRHKVCYKLKACQVGTETSSVWNGYMEVDVNSGQSAAPEFLELLKDQ